MSDYPNVRLEKSIENTQRIVDGSDKGLKIFKSALFEVVAAVLLIALFFCENGTLTVKKQELIVFLGNIAVMFVLSMLFDNNYRIKGKLVGISTDRYKNAYEDLMSIKRELSDEDIDILDEKIEKYLDAEVTKKRKNVLYKSGLTLTSFEEMLKMSEKERKAFCKDRKKLYAIKRALKIKRGSLSTAKLLSETEEKDFVKIGKSGKELDKIHNVKNAVTYLLSASVFAYFAVGLSQDFSLAAFGWYMMKACFLVFRGIKSYFESYIEVTETEVESFVGKKMLLEYFLGKKGTQKNLS